MSKKLDEKVAKMAENEQQLLKLRHTSEHVLHTAMQKLYPELLKAMGPATADGFYFDFDLEGKVTEADFAKIEKEMERIIKSGAVMKMHEIEEKEAKELFAHNPYKIDWINEIISRGESISIYQMILSNGKVLDEDVCSGPHLDSVSEIGAFKLLSVAGAYWHGDEKNKMLTRIYGTAFGSQEELDKYLWQQEEAKKRDHRKLGKELDLFHFSELVGPGLPMFTPRGTIVRRELESFVQSLQEPFGYTRVLIPHLAKTELYEKSGHWAKYKENMFQVNSDDGVKFAMKPMNCPHHIELFARKTFSYRDLPQRYSEVTAVYRQERAGELLGLARVYMLTQDDAHVFCTEEQAIDEALNVYKIIKDFYAAFEFGLGMKVRLSLRDPLHPEKYLGSDDIWKKSENMMRQVAEKAGLEIYEGIGEAAFYAPKLDFMAYDSLGREWQLATIQLDLNFADRFNLKYIGPDGQERRPVIIHRAILGSVERFMSILIEHYAGALPLWLSPVHVKVLPVSEKVIEYCREIEQRLNMEGIRVELDTDSESLGKKIRNAEAMKIPYMLVVGEKEEAENKVSVRHQGQKDLGVMGLASFVEKVKKEIEAKRQEGG